MSEIIYKPFCHSLFIFPTVKSLCMFSQFLNNQIKRILIKNVLKQTNASHNMVIWLVVWFCQI